MIAELRRTQQVVDAEFVLLFLSCSPFSGDDMCRHVATGLSLAFIDTLQ